MQLGGDGQVIFVGDRDAEEQGKQMAILGVKGIFYQEGSVAKGEGEVIIDLIGTGKVQGQVQGTFRIERERLALGLDVQVDRWGLIFSRIVGEDVSCRECKQSGRALVRKRNGLGV